MHRNVVPNRNLIIYYPSKIVGVSGGTSQPGRERKGTADPPLLSTTSRDDNASHEGME